MKSDGPDYESETKTEIRKCDRPVSYTLVDTAAEPVPEPITVAGTALALVGLSWLKQNKKMAV
ncbi:PEP-CTERM sorting domain-containing protein [Microcoleus sp. LEGE 07076]|nr:PEP-CTERM sorting domain-containing protein [Microcoleus sp. LEGE 07076]